MHSFKKSDVTILFICYNESYDIANSIQAFQNMGFSSIVVLDDNSSDDTAQIAKKLKARVIHNDGNLGFNMSLLKALFLSRGKYVVVITAPDMTVYAPSFLNFVDMGVIGNYSLVLSKGQIGKGINFSRILQKRYSIVLPHPSFQAIFLDAKMLDEVRSSVTGNGVYVLFELVKAAVSKNLKIGVMNSGVREMSYKLPFRSRKFHNRRMRSYKKYMKQMFPDLIQIELLRKITSGVIITGVGGALATGLVLLANLLIKHHWGR